MTSTRVDVEQLNNLSAGLQLLDSINFNNEAEVEFNFDITYADYILRDNAAFIDLMKIMIPLYKGENVLILTASNSNRLYEALEESLIKFISTRYSFISYRVNDLDDFYSVKDSSFLTINGLQTLDADRVRYVSLTQRYGGGI